MAKSVCTSENVEVIECMNDVENEVAGVLIDALKKIDAEYDELLKDAKEPFESNSNLYEIRNYDKNDKQFFVPDVIYQSISIIGKSKQKLEEIEINNELQEINKKLKICQNENKIYTNEKAIMERKLNIEKKKIDTLNQQIEDVLKMTENEEDTRCQLEALRDELKNMKVTDTICPDAILEMQDRCQEMQANITRMQEELLKYADLPADYSKAREKLIEARLLNDELERRIRNVISNHPS